MGGVYPPWGRVIASDGWLRWVVVDDAGVVVEPIGVFLRDFAASGNRPLSVRSYAYDLLRWWRWLVLVEVRWDRATSTEVREFVLWLQHTRKPRRSPRTGSAVTAGRVNPVTGKRYLGDGYEPRTVRHSNAVIRAFYAYWIERGDGPLINPVPAERRGGRQGNEHHNPMRPFEADGRLRYNPKVARRLPRAMPDARWNELFAALRSNRDRAILAVAISTAARAAEVLGVRGLDLDWGEQLVRVVRKGTRAEQWLPASSDAFVWIRLYLADLGTPRAPDQPLWWTLRRRDHGQGLVLQPLNYEALRAVLRRVNALLGTNWSMHDLRHTCALRMARDKRLSMRDVQTILGHSRLSTTADVYAVEEQEQVIRRVAEHLAAREETIDEPAPAPAAGYDGADLAVLFGEQIR